MQVDMHYGMKVKKEEVKKGYFADQKGEVIQPKTKRIEPKIIKKEELKHNEIIKPKMKKEEEGKKHIYKDIIKPPIIKK